MLAQNSDGLTQTIISELADVSLATVNRNIAVNNYKHIESGAKKNFRYPIKTTQKIISELSKYAGSPKLKRHCFYNFKGGTGKTSLCFQVSTHIALMGFKTLVIDADPQAHLSTTCGFHVEKNHYTIYDSIINNIAFKDIIKPIFPGYDCIPSNLSLTRLEAELSNLPKREERLKISLKSVEDDYDFIFIDTNPTISHLNRNIITYSDVINIVCETQPYSLNGLRILMEDLDKFFSLMQITKKELNIIPNKYEDRTSSSAEAMTALKEYYSKYIKEDFAIRKSEDINTGAKLGKPLALFAKKNSIALRDVIDLCRHIIAKSEVLELEK